ncbi:hypothetical protein B0H67DRAFT_217385 [Lasiosphaeris hirsuta]|uniref:Uncharacterized protein n=1 Tax=Lasiosphaeris hirsuta TaxID=260670 RepID=A0AA40AF27_9PEZI|nr:hypothetical protein B0H67DRAFT_217385 [Lasiosphaeris hirsuta]
MFIHRPSRPNEEVTWSSRNTEQIVEIRELSLMTNISIRFLFLLVFSLYVTALGYIHSDTWKSNSKVNWWLSLYHVLVLPKLQGIDRIYFWPYWLLYMDVATAANGMIMGKTIATGHSTDFARSYSVLPVTVVIRIQFHWLASNGLAGQWHRYGLVLQKVMERCLDLYRNYFIATPSLLHFASLVEV